MLLFPILQWPFKRLLGLQEPASVAFSLLNLLSNLVMFNRFKEQIRFTLPSCNIWFIYTLVSLLHTLNLILVYLWVIFFFFFVNCILHIWGLNNNNNNSSLFNLNYFQLQIIKYITNLNIISDNKECINNIFT